MSTDSQLFMTLLLFWLLRSGVFHFSLYLIVLLILDFLLVSNIGHLTLPSVCPSFSGTFFSLQMVQISDQMSLLREAIPDHYSHPNTHSLFFGLMFCSTCNHVCLLVYLFFSIDITSEGMDFEIWNWTNHLSYYGRREISTFMTFSFIIPM